MLQKIKNWFAIKYQAKKQNIELKKMQTYYKNLQYGALFLKFVHSDFAKQKKQMNRAERRRWEHSLKTKGQFNKEIIMYYMNHIDKVLNNINTELNKKK